MSEQDQPEQSGVADGGWLTREMMLILMLIVATALAFYVCYRLALPFLPAITWALALAVVAHPLHTGILGRIKRPNLAAGLAVFIVAVIIVTPGVFLAQRLVKQVGRGVETLKAQTGEGQWLNAVGSNPQLARKSMSSSAAAARKPLSVTCLASKDGRLTRKYRLFNVAAPVPAA